MLLSAVIVGVVADRFLSPHATWPTHVIVVLVILGGGVLLLSVLSGLGRKRAVPGVSNEDLMREFQEFKKSVTSGQVVASTEPSDLVSATGSTGTAGSVVSHYEGQGTLSASFKAAAAGTVRAPGWWERFRRYFGITG